MPATRLLVVLMAFLGRPSFAAPEVRGWQDTLVLPTYLVGEPERHPMFYFGRAYQGAKGTIYPYPLLDVLTDIRVEKAYQACYLENEYLRILVLPEIGGRIFEGVDKTNGYNFFYRQHVIRPALIGMLGAWISGGVEWNIPHHHRATSFMPVDWAIVANDDGSKSVWVGETELRHRMRWTVRLTLRPGMSVLEVDYWIANRTPFAHSMLCWANAAVHANENYQIIFPPSTSVATFHGKNEFSRWPISREVYNGVDYSRGVDVSWWKNHPAPTSFFAFESEEDFMAGYDHGRDAGVVFVGRHEDTPGKKVWTWGTGAEGRRWEKILTDTDGPYLELMFGSFSDNQPDYSWIEPGEEKTVRQFWYPVRGIRGVKNANPVAACNLEVIGSSRALVGFHSTVTRRAARAVMRHGQTLLLDRTIEIGPATPFVAEIPVPPGVKESSLEIALFADDGQELIRYKPAERKEGPLPEPVVPPPAPERIPNSEELYLAGLRLEQFHHPAVDPILYYEEVLKRDPGDSRANTALGRHYLMRGMNEEAEAVLRRAISRLSKNYTRPKDGEAFYYLGLAMVAVGREREAMSALARAAWCAGWSAAANAQLAEIASRRRDWLLALDSLDRSLAANALNPKARFLRAAVLRKLSRYEEAERGARESLKRNPLDFWAANELRLVLASRGREDEASQVQEELRRRMRGEVQNHLELAVDYGRCGFLEEAREILSWLEAEGRRNAPCPMTLYYLAYYSHLLGKEDEAREYRRRASRVPAEYCFPFRLESIPVLEWAAKEDPGDARAPHFLGNLLFDRQPERAIAEWEKSAARDDASAAVHRNLGIAYARVRGDPSAGAASLKKAIDRAPEDPRLYFEWEEISDLAGVSPETRLEVLERNHDVVARRDDALAREIALLVGLGRYDRAIDCLRNHHFHVWEGGGGIHDLYVDAYLGRGQRHLAEKRIDRAIEDFTSALEYPENLEVAKPERGGREPEIFYFLGTAFLAAGKPGEARSAFERSVAEPAASPELSYFQGCSWLQLGRDEEARRAFDGVIRSAEEGLARSESLDYFAKFGEKQSIERRRAYYHFLLGLGLRGLGNEAGARAEFSKSLELSPHFFPARKQLEALPPERRGVPQRQEER